MSPELETLDQLLAGLLSLKTVLSVYPSESAFLRGVSGLLASGDVWLQLSNGSTLPDHEWRRVFRDRTVLNNLGNFQLEITDQGARRIA